MLNEYKDSKIWKENPDEINLRSDIIVTDRVIDMLGDISGKKVLDAGCGNGKVSRKLAKAKAAVFGIDKVQDQIDTAKGISPEMGIKYMLGDITNLDALALPNDFDIALSLMTFLYLDNEEFVRAAQQIRKHLRKGGRFIYGNIDPGRFATSSDAYFDQVEKLEASLPTVAGDIFKTTFYRHPYFFVLQTLKDAGFLIREEIKSIETDVEAAKYPMLFPKEARGKSQYLIIDTEAV